ncbi:RNA polymerase sigma-70 factor (ECF subfamily) [Mangrovibacterium diazotrophicum]|uniref:RNA polymerase sigma-70 factor (ECF subfamily) n=1 Tax=Mangrovibacterium diazotrophicum TaxID=1261403 RepID=A0A419VWD1_9BACT|nr:RNA polymerase sigma-70 factor (ECF subfamily) [Mangrovibacterium diazotrophicum]
MAGSGNQEEQFIIQRMIEGDKRAFKYFFDKYYRELCNFVNIYLKDEMLAEEVVQDIFVYFWENKQKIKIHSSVKAYLFGASKYKSLNVLRSQKDNLVWFDAIEASESYIDEIPMEQFSGIEEFRQILNDAILQLPEKCREIFLLSKKQELSNKQIAEQLGVSVKTVENQMTIALKKLRSCLEPHRDKIFLLFLLDFFK